MVDGVHNRCLRRLILLSIPLVSCLQARGSKATLPLTMPRRVFKSSAKDSAHRPLGRELRGLCLADLAQTKYGEVAATAS